MTVIGLADVSHRQRHTSLWRGSPDVRKLSTETSFVMNFSFGHGVVVCLRFPLSGRRKRAHDFSTYVSCLSLTCDSSILYTASNILPRSFPFLLKEAWPSFHVSVLCHRFPNIQVCLILALQKTSHLQNPGPYSVGTCDCELPVYELEAPSEAPSAEAPETVSFRIFYPCTRQSSQRAVRWVPNPQRGYLSAYARFVGANNTVSEAFS